MGIEAVHLQVSVNTTIENRSSTKATWQTWFRRNHTATRKIIKYEWRYVYSRLHRKAHFDINKAVAQAESLPGKEEEQDLAAAPKGDQHIPNAWQCWQNAHIQTEKESRQNISEMVVLHREVPSLWGCQRDQGYALSYASRFMLIVFLRRRLCLDPIHPDQSQHLSPWSCPVVLALFSP